MRYLLYPFLLLGLVSSIYSQNKYEILETDAQNFKKILSEGQFKLDNSDWEKLRRKSINYKNEFNFKIAESYATKARILAEFLNDPVLIGRSLYLLGNIQPPQPQYRQIAALNYQESLTTFTKVEKTLQSRKWVGYVYNDLARLNLNPNFVHSETEIKNGAFFLHQVFQMMKKYPVRDFLDLEVLTSLNLSDYFNLKGHIPTQIVWLENAEELNTNNENNENFAQNLFEIYIRLQRAYRRIGDYQKAFQTLEKLKLNLKKYQNDFQKLEYLRQLEDSYADIGNTKKMFETLDEGLSLTRKLNFRNGEFQTLKILRLLQEERIDEAEKQLNLILRNEEINLEKIDLSVIKAVIAGYKGNKKLSDEQFAFAEKALKEELHDEWKNKMFVLNHELRVAVHLKDFEKVKTLCRKYLEVAEANNNKDSIPFIYLNLAKAEFNLRDLDKALEHTLVAIKIIEDKRKVSSAPVSIGIMEVLYEAYELRTTIEIEKDKFIEALNSSEAIKSRWLYDRVTKNPLKHKDIFESEARNSIYNASLNYLANIEDAKFENELRNLEDKILFYESKVDNENNVEYSNLHAELEKLNLNKVAIISYKFTTDDKLAAFIYKPGSKLQINKLNLSKSEVDQLAIRTQSEIKSRVYYKNQGKELFDLLLNPLKMDDAEHLIVIPENSLWKIPFQALSPDGKKYLIENVKISYAPSISVLLSELKKSKPERKIFRVFSNAKFDIYFLKYADAEANSLASMFGIKPIQKATISNFNEGLENFDVIHFSMHASIETDPFDSFLAFQGDNSHPDGRLTVTDLLNIKLKPQSLVFLASCTTDNVFKSEGLLSLAWGMMNAGATTVISTQWEANDESTEEFTKGFYKYYKQGFTPVESMQKVSIDMIHSSDNRFKKPANWAEFTLSGDFR